MGNNICVFDLDNTLYDFVDFFAPAFRGMISAISQKTNISEKILIEDAKEVYQKRGFLEYYFLIREMKSFLNYNKDDIIKLELLARIVFGKIRKSRLKLYPNMYDVISNLYDGGVTIVAITNAPRHQTCKRLKDLQINKFFSRVICIEDPEIPDYYTAKINPCKNISTIILTRTESKPSPTSYEKLKEYYSDKSNFWVVGDNVDRDLKPASNLGYKTIWASYGCEIDKKNYDTAYELTPSNLKKHETSNKTYTPDYTIKNPLELLEIIPYVKQLNLLDFIEED